MTDERPTRRRSLFGLIGDVPRLITDLARAEIDSLKREILGKLAAAAVGLGLLAAASALLFYMLGTLVAAAVLGIGQALPLWLAALIVAGGLLLIAAGLGLWGVLALKHGVPPTPDSTIDSIKKDVRVIKGIGKDAA